MGAKGVYMECRWKRLKRLWKTDCDHTITLRLQNAVYCPYCGGKIVKDRQIYQKEYYEANRGKISLNQRQYYLEHREEIKKRQMLKGVGK